MAGVQLPPGAMMGIFSPLHRVQTGSAIHPSSHLTGTAGSYSGAKVAGTWKWPLNSI